MHSMYFYAALGYAVFVIIGAILFRLFRKRLIQRRIENLERQKQIQRNRSPESRRKND